MVTEIDGKKGTVNIKDAGDVLVKDNKKNSNYVVKNKKEGQYGYNTFEFAANSGADTIKGYDSYDSISFAGATDLHFSKKGTSDDLVITKNNGKDSVVLKDYFASYGIGGLDLEDEEIEVSGSGKINGTDYDDSIEGSKKADTIRTGYGTDYITAGKGNDTIIADGYGYKKVYVNKGDGNDIVKRDDTAIVRAAQRKISDEVNIVFEDKILRKVEIEQDEVTYTYTKSFADLKVTATHSDGKSESVTIKNYFDVDLPMVGDSGRFENVSVNYDDVDEIMAESGVLVDPVKVSQLIKDYNLSEMIKKIGIKIPGALSDVNVFLGSNFDDTFIGTKGKDLMVALDGNNDFTTGSKGQTVIASLGYDHGSERYIESEYTASGNDVYDVTSFNAGTVIVDAGGENELAINGVDVNDIHMASYLNKDSESSSGIAGILSNVDIAYFTDSKGVKNIAGINFNGIYNKVMDTIQNARYNPSIEDIDSKTLAKIQKKYKYGTDKFDEEGYLKAIDDKLDEMKESHMKTAIKNVNSLLTTATDLIDKFRGVAIAAAKDDYDDGYLEQKGSDLLQKDITVIDTKGNEQTISVENMDVYQGMIEDRMEMYFSKISSKYAEHLAKLGFGSSEELYPKAELRGLYYDEGISNVVDFAKYLLMAPDNENFKKADKKIYDAIKSGFFELYDNAFIGTSGDNEYTIKNADDGAMIVSGTGNDTFTFKGTLMNKIDIPKDKPISIIEKAIVPRFSMGQTYDIVSNVRKAQPETPETPAMPADKDVIKVTDYSFDDKTLSISPYQGNFERDYETGDVYFRGLSMTAIDYKKNNTATINYGIDEQFSSNLALRKDFIVLDDYKVTGYDVTNDSFDNLTIIDSTKKEYNVIAKYSDDSVACNWSGDLEKGKNHIAMLDSMDTTVKSNNGTNIISVTSYAYDEEKATLNYTYGGGNDMVYSSSYYSDDIYNVEFDKNTKFSVYDDGGDDELNITADVSKLKLFFNVESGGDYDDYELQFIASDNMKKSNFSVLKMYGYTQLVADKGILIDDCYIETIKITDGDNSFELETGAALNDIASDVAGWLSTSKKNFADVNDVFERGSKSEIAEVLAIYNNADLSLYQQDVK